MTALLAKATALALARHPGVNASCKDGKSFTYNIAVAGAMDGGLLTPVLQNADKVFPFCFINLTTMFACVNTLKEFIDLMHK